MRRIFAYLFFFICTVICVSIFLFSENLLAEGICSIDLNNQEQVVERLALLKLKVRGISQNKSEQYFFNLAYEDQLKQFAEKFDVDEEMFDLKVKNMAERILQLSDEKEAGRKQAISEEIRRLKVDALEAQRKEKLLSKLKDDGFEGFDSVRADSMTPLLHYSSIGDSHTVSELLYYGVDPNRVGIRGKSPLMSAALSGSVEVFEILIAHNASYKIVDLYGQTALSYAARGKGQNKIFEKLLSMSAPDSKDAPALIQAVKFGSLSTVQLSIRHGADVNVMEAGERTALSFAVEMGDKDKVGMLLNHKADYKLGREPLLVYAVVRRDFEMIEFLLHRGVDINIKNQNGEGALRCAVFKKDTEMVSFLLKQGADPNEVSVGLTFYKTLLDLASVNDNSEIVKLLKEYGAKE